MAKTEIAGLWRFKKFYRRSKKFFSNGGIKRLFEWDGLILAYHRVADLALDPFNLSVSIENFMAQMAFLKRNYRIAKLSEVVKESKSVLSIGKVVCLTFDDGYRDNFCNAMPILEKLKIPATFFIASGYLDGSQEFYWDTIERIFLNPGTLPPQLDLKVGSQNYHFELGGSSVYTAEQLERDKEWRIYKDEPINQRQVLFLKLYELLRSVNLEQRDAIIKDLFDWSGVNLKPRVDYSTIQIDELRVLSKNPLFEIGGHTESHADLSFLDKAIQKKEIEKDKLKLEHVLKVPLSGFAYPYGSFNDQTVGLTRDSGFQYAVTTEHGIVRKKHDEFLLTRFNVNNWDGIAFPKKLEQWFKRRN